MKHPEPMGLAPWRSQFYQKGVCELPHAKAFGLSGFLLVKKPLLPEEIPEVLKAWEEINFWLDNELIQVLLSENHDQL